MFRRPTDRIQQLRTALDHARQRLGAAMQRDLANRRRQVAERLHALGAMEPRARLRLAQHRVAGADEQLRAAMARTLRGKLERLDALARHLESVGPRSVLQRGYSYTTTETGALVRSTADVRGGQKIVTHLADGRVASQVLGPDPAPPPATSADSNTPAAPPPVKPRKRSPAKPGAADAGLFGTP